MWKGDRDIYVTSDWDAFQLQPRYTWAWITLLIHSVLTSSIKRHYFGREQGESWKRQASKTTSVQTSDHTQTLVTQCQITGEFVNQQHILKCFGLIAYDTFFREKNLRISVLWGILLEYYVDFSFNCQWGKSSNQWGTEFFPEAVVDVRNNVDLAFRLLSVQLMIGLLSDLRSAVILQPAAEATLFITPPSVHSCANPVTLYTAKKSSRLNGSISLHWVL